MLNHPRCRCAKEPNRHAGVSGIKMRSRSIEDVSLADGASGNLPVPTEETDDRGAAARKCHVARKGLRPAATNATARRGPMRFRSSVQRAK